MFVVLLAGICTRPLWAQSKSLVTVTAATNTPITAGGGAAVLVTIKIKHGYHINTNPASEDFLIPVQIKITGKDGISGLTPLYPPGKKVTFAFSPKPVSVFEGEVYIPVPLVAAQNARAGKHSLQGTVHYQACNDKTCLIPSDVKFSFDIMVQGAAKVAVRAGATGGTAAPASAAPAKKAPVLSPDARALALRFKVTSIPAVIFLDGDGIERKDLRAGGELTPATMLAKMAAVKSGNKLATGSKQSFAWPAQFQSVPVWVLVGLMFLSWSVVLKDKKVVAVPLVLVALACGYGGWRVSSRPAPGANGGGPKVNWPEATLAGLKEAKGQRRPIVLDFRAEWCLPCHRIEDQVFARNDVKAAAEGVGLYQVDVTNAPRA